MERTNRPLTVTHGELAKILGISSESLIRMRKNGHMPVPQCQLGGHPRFPLQQVAEWLGFAEVPDDLDDMRLVTVPEAARMIGTSTSSLYQHIDPLARRARVYIGGEQRFVKGRVIG